MQTIFLSFSLSLYLKVFTLPVGGLHRKSQVRSCSMAELTGMSSQRVIDKQYTNLRYSLCCKQCQLEIHANTTHSNYLSRRLYEKVTQVCLTAFAFTLGLICSFSIRYGIIHSCSTRKSQQEVANKEWLLYRLDTCGLSHFRTYEISFSFVQFDRCFTEHPR